MDKIEGMSKYLKAIADPTRLKIIKLLNSNKPLCVNAIAKRLNLTQSAISQHLRILRQLNLVSGNKMGYYIHYQINKNEMTKFSRLFSEIILKN
ncbi:MAG: winged helix-turn-helix transcriptional regulator [Bacteroidales bacterium]|nr:MAG: winged helix-turn-helix transcriptional regulator [Bacteroidales bacterium]